MEDFFSHISKTFEISSIFVDNNYNSQINIPVRNTRQGIDGTDKQANTHGPMQSINFTQPTNERGNGCIPVILKPKNH